MTVQERQLATSHDHLQGPFLDVLHGKTQAIPDAGVALAGSQEKVLRLDRHHLSTRTPQVDFSDMCVPSRFDLDALGSIDTQDPGEVLVSKYLEETSWFDDLLSQS